MSHTGFPEAVAIVCSPPYCATGQDFDAYLALDPQATLGMRGRVEEHMALCGPSGGADAAETAEPEEAEEDTSLLGGHSERRGQPPPSPASPASSRQLARPPPSRRAARSDNELEGELMRTASAASSR